MNEDLNLKEILKNCLNGTKLYSPIFGEVMFVEIDNHKYCPIATTSNRGYRERFTSDGKYSNCEGAECVLFPSKDNRDWSTFKIEQPNPEHKFKPFDRVLVRNWDSEYWNIAFFAHATEDDHFRYNVIPNSGKAFNQCIPYEGNEHLFNTKVKPE